MTTYNVYVIGDASHPAGFPMDKNVASHIPTSCDLLIYVGDVYPQGVRYCFEVGTNIRPGATTIAGFDYAFGERSGHNLVPKMAMLPGNHEYKDAQDAGTLPAGVHSGDASTLLPVGFEYYWTRPANTYYMKADGTIGSGADPKTVLSNAYPNSKTPINNTAFNGGSTPATYNGVTQGRHDFYFDIGGVRHIVIDDSQYTGAIPAGLGGGGGDEAFMPLANGTPAQQARWQKLTGWVTAANTLFGGNSVIIYAHRTRYPTGNANGNHKPSPLLAPFHAFCTGKIIAWIHGHWHNASATVAIKAGTTPTALADPANRCAVSGAGTVLSPRIITNNDGFPIFCQGNGGNSLNGFQQQYVSLGQVPDALREYGDPTNYGYMHIAYDDNTKITFEQHSCGSVTANAATTDNIAHSVTYKTTVSGGPPPPPPPPVAPSFTQTPADPDTDTTPTFGWQANDAVTASYQYRVDGAAVWSPTAQTSVTLPPLAASASPGTSHTFHLRAVASDGVTFSPEVAYTWHIATATTGAPGSFASSLGATGATTNSSSVTFSWAANADGSDATFQYTLDGAAPVSVNAALMVALTGIGVGSHSFQVRALSASGVPSAWVPATPYAWTVNTLPPPSGRVTFGRTQATGSPPDFSRTLMQNAEGGLSRQIELVHTLYNFGDAAPDATNPAVSDERWLLDRGSLPIINCLGRLTPAANAADVPNAFPGYTNAVPGGNNDAGVTDIANGVYDAKLKEWAQYSKDLVDVHGVRPWREMTNGAGACVWKTSTGAVFIAAWKRLYTIFKGDAAAWTNYNTNINPTHPIAGSPIHATNARMIWCPAIFGGVWDTWYPGDAWVDLNGTDGYSYDTAATATNSNGPQGGWHTFKQIFANWYAQFNPVTGTISRKPMLICEVNAKVSTDSSRDRAQWWTDALANLKNDFPGVLGVTVWVDSSWPDLGVAGSPEYITFANDPIMASTSFPGEAADVVTITVTAPAADLTVTNAAYTLTGSASGGAGLALTINGAAASLSGGNFSVPVTLAVGANVFNFVATDTSGATDAVTRTITYTPATSGGGTLPATDNGVLHEAMDAQIYSVAHSQALTTHDWQTIADTYDLFIENPPGARLYPFADDIKLRNPNIWLGTYNKGTGIPTSLTGLPEKWYAHTSVNISSANRLHLSGSTAHWMAQPDGVANWTDTAGSVGPAGHVYKSWKEYHAAEIATAIAAVNARYASTPYAAKFLDSLGVGDFNGQVDPSNGIAYVNEKPVWYGIVNQMVSYIRSATSGDLIVSNGGDTNTGLANVSDVTMIEGFMFATAFNTPTTRLNPAAFRAICNAAIAAQTAGAYVVLLDKTWDSATSTLWHNVTAAALAEVAQLEVAAYHLVNQGKALIEWSVQQSVEGLAKPWDANRSAYWSVDLDLPRVTKATFDGYLVASNIGTNGGEVYARPYRKGLVVVNTGDAAYALALDRADYHEVGSATLLTSPYQVPARGAAVLVTDAAPGAAIQAVAPFPVVTGTPTQGQPLTTTDGTFSDGTQLITPATIAYSWERALDDGAGGVILPFVRIAGPVNKTFRPGSGSVGYHVRSRVTGFDAAGNSASAVSDPTPIIAAAPQPPPTIVSPPSVTPNSASPQVGDILIVKHAVFSGATSNSLVLQRGDDVTGAWADIPGTTDTSTADGTYTVQSADIGFEIRPVETGTNAGGGITSPGTPTPVVLGPPIINPPMNVSLPQIIGDPLVGSDVTFDRGEWTGDNLVFTLQLERRPGGDLTVVDEGAPYRIVQADDNHVLVLLVTASNAAGTLTVESPPTAVVGVQGLDATVISDDIAEIVLRIHQRSV